MCGCGHVEALAAAFGKAGPVTLTPPEALAAHPHAVLSHESAARALGIALHEDAGAQRLTVPRNHSHVDVPGWSVRRCNVDVLLLPDGARVTKGGQTVVDLARVLSVEHAVVAGDDALRKRLVTLAVVADLARATKGRGRREVLAAVALLDPASGSVLESLFRVLVATAGLPAPATQVQLADGSDVLARFDFCWRTQRLIVELDGLLSTRIVSRTAGTGSWRTRWSDSAGGCSGSPGRTLWGGRPMWSPS
jgi:hypothetical protein